MSVSKLAGNVRGLCARSSSEQIKRFLEERTSIRSAVLLMGMPEKPRVLFVCTHVRTTLCVMDEGDRVTEMPWLSVVCAELSEVADGGGFAEGAIWRRGGCSLGRD